MVKLARLCRYCRGEIPTTLGERAEFCGRRCRQAFWRARRASLLQASDGQPKRVAYADPPFPGLARKYYQHESTYAGEVDHAALIERLRGFDGWALSTSSKALRAVWNLCPEARLAVWVKVHPPRHKRGVQNVFECVLFVPVRAEPPCTPDALWAQAARGGGSLPGRKSRRFCQWLFGLLGLRAGDDFSDLFPGSGIVGRVWSAAQGTSNMGAEPDPCSTLGADLRIQPASAPSPGDGASLEYSADGVSLKAPADVWSLRTVAALGCWQPGLAVGPLQPSSAPGGDGASFEAARDESVRQRAAAPSDRQGHGETSLEPAGDAGDFVDCQSCGERVSAKRWPRHIAEHWAGKRPVLSAVEAFLRHPAAETSLEPAGDGVSSDAASDGGQP